MKSVSIKNGSYHWIKIIENQYGQISIQRGPHLKNFGVTVRDEKNRIIRYREDTDD